MKNSEKEFEAVVQGHRGGHGFLIRDDGQDDVYLPLEQMQAVLHGDHVKACIARHDHRGRSEGRVLEILQRPLQTIIGRLVQENGLWLVAPEDRRFGQDILIAKDALAGAQKGQVVVSQLTEPPALHGQPVGRIVEVLGDLGDPGMEVEIAVRKFGLPHEFSDAALAQARKLPDALQNADYKKRVNLTDLPLVTIDGEDARDFDDAVYCEPAVVTGRGKKPNGWRLLVAIADVSHYVKTGSALDDAAYERATSAYFPRRVIPMLPEKLSNGLCSLNPGADRLSLVCDMLVTAGGEVKAYQFYPAVIRSHARLTYTQVAEILTHTRGPQALQHADRVQDLLHLHEVFKALLTSRKKRGAVDFDTVETEIVFNEAGRIEQIVPSQRSDAHRLIEECMLAANVCASDFIIRHKHPGLYRVHAPPQADRVATLQAYLKTINPRWQVSDEPTPAEFQQLAEASAGRADTPQIHMMLLRAMSQAVYTPENAGHFGLAYPAYAHFTSPIRRYPDLLLHRAIKAILAGKTYRLPVLPEAGTLEKNMSKRWQDNQAAKRDGKDKSSKKPTLQDKRWQLAGLHCSACERRAEEASRDVEAWLKCEYMRQHLGEEFAATISTVTSFGFFVMLDALYVEGLVHVRELGHDYYRYDDVRQCMVGERSGKVWKVGDRLQVQVSRVNLDERKIDFRLLSEAGQHQKPARSEAAGQKKRRAEKTRL